MAEQLFESPFATANKLIRVLSRVHSRLADGDPAATSMSTARQEAAKGMAHELRITGAAVAATLLVHHLDRFDSGSVEQMALRQELHLVGARFREILPYTGSTFDDSVAAYLTGSNKEHPLLALARVARAAGDADPVTIAALALHLGLLAEEKRGEPASGCLHTARDMRGALWRKAMRPALLPPSEALPALSNALRVPEPIGPLLRSAMIRVALHTDVARLDAVDAMVDMLVRPELPDDHSAPFRAFASAMLADVHQLGPQKSWTAYWRRGHAVDLGTPQQLADFTGQLLREATETDAAAARPSGLPRHRRSRVSDRRFASALARIALQGASLGEGLTALTAVLRTHQPDRAGDSRAWMQVPTLIGALPEGCVEGATEAALCAYDAAPQDRFAALRAYHEVCAESAEVTSPPTGDASKTAQRPAGPLHPPSPARGSQSRERGADRPPGR